MTGQSIKDYTFGRVLGEGGMATVYLATNNKFRTDVAIKVLNKEFVYNTNVRNRFIAEARNMFRMSHPNIIKVTDLIEEGDIVAFVMEYINGGTLKDWLAQKANLLINEVKPVFYQMLDAVKYVHEQGLIHRDIKPSNFIIDRKGKVCLLDFGISKNTDASSAEYTQTSTSQNMGTPMYMSPEQVKDPGKVVAQSDIYSLGVVLWQLISGKKPYDADTQSTFHIHTKIVTDPLPFTNTIWDDIIQKATRKNVNDRYRTIEEFKYAIENMLPTSNQKPARPYDSESTVFELAKFNTPSTPLITHKKSNNKIFILLSLILVGVALIAFLLINRKQSGNSHPTTEHTTSEDDDTVEPEVIKASFTDPNGLLVFQSDCYVIVTGSFADENNARSYVVTMRNQGHGNAGYLWIPDYPSLSGLRLFATFIGPYQTYEDCNMNLRQLKINSRFWYGKKVSHDPRKVEIRIK